MIVDPEMLPFVFSAITAGVVLLFLQGTVVLWLFTPRRLAWVWRGSWIIVALSVVCAVGWIRANTSQRPIYVVTKEGYAEKRLVLDKGTYKLANNENVTIQEKDLTKGVLVINDTEKAALLCKVMYMEAGEKWGAKDFDEIKELFSPIPAYSKVSTKANYIDHFGREDIPPREVKTFEGAQEAYRWWLAY